MNPQSFRAIFVSDLDGTLLRDDKTASREDTRALCELQKHGVLRAVATGRSIHSARKCLPPDFPVDYLIVSTGNQIIRWPDGEALQSARLTLPEIEKTHELLTGLGVSFMIHDDFPDTHHFSYHRGPAPSADFERRLNLHAAYAREYAGLPGNASQFLAVLDPGRDDLFHVIAKASPELSVVRVTSPLDNSSIWVEIFARGVSKASAIDALLRRHGLNGVLTGAIGNDHNDREMLERVHLPYVVAGAFLPHEPRHIKTPGNNSGAVSFAVSHFLKALNHA